MNGLKAFFTLFFITLTVSCSPIYGVSYDYQRTVNFTHLMTYDWLPVPKEANISSLDLARIKSAVNSELEAKGLKMTSRNPDFLIAEHLGTKDKVIIDGWGYYDDPYLFYWRGYRGYGGLTAYQYEEGIIILDFVDPGSKNLIWRGTAKGVLSGATTPEKRDTLVKEAIRKILKHFPPTP